MQDMQKLSDGVMVKVAWYGDREDASLTFAERFFIISGRETILGTHGWLIVSNATKTML